MVSLNIAVPESAKSFIDRQVAGGTFRDVDEYILTLIEADRARRVREELETQLVKGLQSPSQLMPDDEWDEIRRTGEAMFAKRGAR